MRKLFFAICVVAIFLVSVTTTVWANEKEISDLASSLSDKIATAGVKRVAVIDFTDLQGNVTELGRFLAEEFSVALAENEKGYTVVDRTYLKSILKELFKEQKYAKRGIMDMRTTKKLGQIAGVDALITGSITPLGDNIRITVKILDTATAEVLGAADGDLARTKDIDELLGNGIEQAQEAQNQAGPRPASNNTNSTKVQPVEVKDFVFKVQQCKYSGQSVKCSILIKNNGEDRYFCFSPNQSVIFDDAGNQFKADSARYGSETPRWTGVGYLMTIRIPPGLTANVVFTFNGPTFNSNKIPFLEIQGGTTELYGKPSSDLDAQFRNIPLNIQ
ncbi:MAG: FlgO family outer membrane protein [Nitrospirota bacterium]